MFLILLKSLKYRSKYKSKFKYNDEDSFSIDKRKKFCKIDFYRYNKKYSIFLPISIKKKRDLRKYKIYGVIKPDKKFLIPHYIGIPFILKPKEMDFDMFQIVDRYEKTVEMVNKNEVSKILND